MIHPKTDEGIRLRALLQEKNDKLEDLRKSLKQTLLENGRLSQQVASQAKQLNILFNDKTESQQRFDATSILAKKLDLKLQMATSRLDTANANEGLPDKLRDAQERLALAKKKLEKQSELLHQVTEENAVLTRAIALHCRDADDAVDVVKENALLSIQVDRMQKDIERLSRDRGESLKLIDELEASRTKFDRESAKCEFLESQLQLIPQLKADLSEAAQRAFILEAKEKALKDDNVRLSETIKHLRQAIDTQEESLISVSHQVENSRHSLTEEKSKRSSLERELAELKNLRTESLVAETRAKDQLKAVLENYNTQEELVSRLQDEIKSLMHSSLREKTSRSTLQDELGRQRQIIADLEARSSYHSEELLDLRAQHHRTQREVDIKERQVEKLRSLIGADTLAKAKRLADN